MARNAETPAPSAETVERLQRRRTWGVLFQVLFYANWQLLFLPMLLWPFNWPAESQPALIRAVVYPLLPLLMLAFVATGGGFIFSRPLRAVLNDETTRDHRRRAFEAGYWAAIAGAVLAYEWSLAKPLTPLAVIHLVLSAGVGLAIVTFAVLELRAQADG